MLVSAVLLAFGLAVLYSASAIVAMQREPRTAGSTSRGSSTGVLAGIVAFAIAAKLDAEKLARVGVADHVVHDRDAAARVSCCPRRIAPRINGSRALPLRQLVPAVGVRQARRRRLDVDAHREEGRQLRRLTKGVLPFFVVIGVLDVLAALEPDLSVAMLYTLLLALLLFVGGVAHRATSSRSARCAIPVLWHEDREGAVRAAATHRVPRSGRARRRR